MYYRACYRYVLFAVFSTQAEVLYHIYKRRSATERFISDKARITGILNSLICLFVCERIFHTDVVYKPKKSK